MGAARRGTALLALAGAVVAAALAPAPLGAQDPPVAEQPFQPTDTLRPLGPHDANDVAPSPGPPPAFVRRRGCARETVVRIAALISWMRTLPAGDALAAVAERGLGGRCFG